jgi:acyl-CoA-binding protein
MSIGRKNEDLAEYVARMMRERGFSENVVSENARNKGLNISQGYVNNIKNRVVLGESITTGKIAALAAGLDVPEFEVYAAARGIQSKKNPDIENAALYLREMPVDRREDALVILEALYRRHRQNEPAREKPGKIDSEKNEKSAGAKSGLVGKSKEGGTRMKLPLLRSKTKTNNEEPAKKKE